MIEKQTESTRLKAAATKPVSWDSHSWLSAHDTASGSLDRQECLSHKTGVLCDLCASAVEVLKDPGQRPGIKRGEARCGGGKSHWGKLHIGAPSGSMEDLLGGAE